jgi:1-acyl-sn-glycerol-3-phosphate acyltransferase
VLRTIFFYICFFPWTALVVICGAPFSLISPDYMHSSGRIWGVVALWLAGVRLEVEGHEHLPAAGQPVIFAGNHQGNFDILCYFAGLPLQFRWMAKEELFRVPLFGLAMRRSGYISIDRSDRRKAMKSMSVAAERIRSGTSVVIFPEGTRSDDGKLQEFKKGGFLIALKAQVPIVPVATSGSWQVMRKGELKIHPGTVRLKILPPIDILGLTNKDSDALLEQVRHSLAEALGEESSNATVN